MDIQFSRKLYYSDLTKGQIPSMKRKIKRWSPKINLFLVTLPIGSQGILEVYWYPELLQPFYRKLQKTVFVVGVAKSKEEAFLLVERIVRDVGVQDGTIPVCSFFEEGAIMTES